MMRFALIGHPLGHSLSAEYFTEKFSREGLLASYSPLDIERAEGVLPHCEDLVGFNVTIPHKSAIIPLLAAITDEAAAVGAVNCVKVTPDGLIGYNTDIIGIRTSLEGFDLKGVKALVLGTGGASKAVQYVLRESGAEVVVVSRQAGVADITYAELNAAIINECRLIINTTPLGMYPDIDSAPAIPYEAITSDHALFDVVYNPCKTKFLQLGSERGARTIDGLRMFYAQAEASWRIWNE